MQELYNNKYHYDNVSYTPGIRGYQVFILNERTGEVINKTVFDTWGGGVAEARNLAAYLEGVSYVSN